MNKTYSKISKDFTFPTPHNSMYNSRLYDDVSMTCSTPLLSKTFAHLKTFPTPIAFYCMPHESLAAAQMLSADMIMVLLLITY